MTYPAVPIGDQFQHPTNPRSVLEDATGMHTAVDVALNNLRAYMLGQPTSNLARLRLSHRATSGTAVAANATIKFDTTEADSAGGWSATTGLYTVPPGGGLFMLSGQVVQGVASAVSVYISGIPTSLFASGIINSYNAATSARAARLHPVTVRFIGGEQIALRPAAALTLAGTTAGFEQHRFEAIQLGH